MNLEQKHICMFNIMTWLHKYQLNLKINFYLNLIEMFMNLIYI
jgi:hypothetical protein